MKKSVILFFVLLFTSLQSELIEIQSFKEVSPHVTKESLVILDIDDTLLIPAQMLGCDEWFKYRLDLHQKGGMSFSQALEKSLTEWEAIRHLTRMDIVEPESDKIVSKMQEQGHHVMGLSTQRHVLAACTLRQLQENRFDLSKTAPASTDHYFTLKENGVLYRNGVLFTSGTHKGKALFKLCESMNYLPKKIVFINDKDTHLKEIEEEAKRMNIDFIGLRYGYSDSKKAAFQPEIAEIQFSHSKLGGLMSDEEAIKFRENKRRESLASASNPVLQHTP